MVKDVIRKLINFIEIIYKIQVFKTEKFQISKFESFIPNTLENLN